MYHSESIITAIEANKILALKLEKALSGVQNNVVDSLKRMEKGAIRASYLLSCFTDNYQDVCANLKHEDARFGIGLIQLVKDRDAIFVMIKIYIEVYLSNKNEDRIENIKRKLIADGVFISNTKLTKELLVYSVAMAVCSGYGFQSMINERISKLNLINFGVGSSIFALNVNGLIQEAADCANQLRNYNAFYYAALYERGLEMMYLFIKPLIKMNPYLNPLLITDDELVELIKRIAR